MLIDIHCHLNCLPESKIFKLLSCQDYIFIDSSTNYSSSLISWELSKEHKSIYSSLGFHPFWAKEFSPKVLEDYRHLIDSSKKILSLGEVGLDYKSEIPLKKQEGVFEAFIGLAKEKELPLVIHNRLDSLRIFEVLDNFLSSYKKVIFHCFSYSQDLLKKILEKGGFVSFSLNVLRKRKYLIDALKFCPFENLFIETDSPYMRIADRASTPLDIKEVYSFIAQSKKITPEGLAEIVLANTKKVFAFNPRQ